MNQSDKIAKYALVGIIIISCVLGFYFNSKASITFYKKILFQVSDSTETYHSWANIRFILLHNSEAINEIKRSLPINSCVGFYSTAPFGYTHMMYSVLQNLLIPILLDRYNPDNHRYVIMFLRGVNADSIILKFNRRIIRAIGFNLYLTDTLR